MKNLTMIIFILLIQTLYSKFCLCSLNSNRNGKILVKHNKDNNYLKTIHQVHSYIETFNVFLQQYNNIKNPEMLLGEQTPILSFGKQTGLNERIHHSSQTKITKIQKIGQLSKGNEMETFFKGQILQKPFYTYLGFQSINSSESKIIISNQEYPQDVFGSQTDSRMNKKDWIHKDFSLLFIKNDNNLYRICINFTIFIKKMIQAQTQDLDEFLNLIYRKDCEDLHTSDKMEHIQIKQWIEQQLQRQYDPVYVLPKVVKKPVEKEEVEQEVQNQIPTKKQFLKKKVQDYGGIEKLRKKEEKQKLKKENQNLQSELSQQKREMIKTEIPQEQVQIQNQNIDYQTIQEVSYESLSSEEDLMNHKLKKLQKKLNDSSTVLLQTDDSQESGDEIEQIASLLEDDNEEVLKLLAQKQKFDELSDQNVVQNEGTNYQLQTDLDSIGSKFKPQQPADKTRLSRIPRPTLIKKSETTQQQLQHQQQRNSFVSKIPNLRDNNPNNQNNKYQLDPDMTNQKQSNESKATVTIQSSGIQQPTQNSVQVQPQIETMNLNQKQQIEETQIQPRQSVVGNQKVIQNSQEFQTNFILLRKYITLRSYEKEFEVLRKIKIFTTKQEQSEKTEIFRLTIKSSTNKDNLFKYEDIAHPGKLDIDAPEFQENNDESDEELDKQRVEFLQKQMFIMYYIKFVQMVNKENVNGFVFIIYDDLSTNLEDPTTFNVQTQQDFDPNQFMLYKFLSKLKKDMEVMMESEKNLYYTQFKRVNLDANVIHNQLENTLSVQLLDESQYQHISEQKLKRFLESIRQIYYNKNLIDKETEISFVKEIKRTI